LYALLSEVEATNSDIISELVQLCGIEFTCMLLTVYTCTRAVTH